MLIIYLYVINKCLWSHIEVIFMLLFELQILMKVCETNLIVIFTFFKSSFKRIYSFLFELYYTISTELALEYICRNSLDFCILCKVCLNE